MEKNIKSISFQGKFVSILYEDGTNESVLYTSLMYGLDDKLLNKVMLIESTHNLQDK